MFLGGVFMDNKELLDSIKKEAFQNNLENLQKNKINTVNKSLGAY